LLGWQGVRSEHTTVRKRRTTKPAKMNQWHDSCKLFFLDNLHNGEDYEAFG